MISLKNINLDLPEGRLLLATLSQLSTREGYSNKTPDEILTEMYWLANEICPERVATTLKYNSINHPQSFNIT